MDVVIDNIGLYWSGFLKTLQICLYAAVGSLALGTVLGAFRVSPLPPLRWVGTGWVTVFRNCPLTVVLFFVAFGLPEIGVNGAYFWFGVSGLVLYTSAFVCEAVRSGVNAVPLGQAEAARAMGLTFGQTMTQVILPQSFRATVPPLASVLIALAKNTSVAAAFGLLEATARMRGFTNNQADDRPLIFLTFAIGYIIIVEVMSAGAFGLERRWRTAR